MGSDFVSESLIITSLAWCGFFHFHDSMFQWGANLQWKDRFGVRYDGASVPQPIGLPSVDRHTFSIWIDPLAIWVD